MLKMCLGISQVMGRCVYNFVIEFFDGMQSYMLFIFIECNVILDNREEILIFVVVRVYFYLEVIVEKIFELDLEVEIFLFVGRDVLFFYKIYEL